MRIGYFPLTPALSLRERENLSPRFRQSRAPRLAAAWDAVFPLPAGQGEGCVGNTRTFSSNVFKAFPSPRPSPLVHRGEKTMRGLLPCLCRLSCGLLSGHEHKFDDVRGKGFFAQTRRERRAYPTVDL